MSDFERYAKEALKRAEEKAEADRELSAALTGKEFALGPMRFGWPTLASLLAIQDLGLSLEALSGEQVRLRDVLAILATIELTTVRKEEFKGKTTEERQKMVEARVEEVAEQIPLEEAPKFVEEAIKLLGRLLTGPSRGGGDAKPFQASQSDRAPGEGVEDAAG